jgi:regulator of protease activity HflC (stomatin/prohibitin superfamily)
MNRQHSAERTRRAVITESEGRRQSEINVAEGEKQANILRAEGERQAQILRAEAFRQAQILNAEGFSLALERIYAAARTIDQKTMLLQYLDALKAIGASPSTTYVIPTEFTQFIEPLVRGLGAGMAAGAAPVAPPPAG